MVIEAEVVEVLGREPSSTRFKSEVSPQFINDRHGTVRTGSVEGAKLAPLVQRLECFRDMEEVSGSIPERSTN